MADGDNSDISAEKMRQAKAKLDGLRRQLQMLAATGDVRQLRRIAAEAARLAPRGRRGRPQHRPKHWGRQRSKRLPAARRQRQSAANAAAYKATSRHAGARECRFRARLLIAAVWRTRHVTTGAAAGEHAGAILQGAPSTWSAMPRNAVLQAKGIIALAAQIARSKRRGGDGRGGSLFRGLQAVVDGALDDTRCRPARRRWASCFRRWLTGAGSAEQFSPAHLSISPSRHSLFPDAGRSLRLISRAFARPPQRHLRAIGPGNLSFIAGNLVFALSSP